MQDPFWNNHYSKFTESEPSKFANFCRDNYLMPTDTVIELGCGNGRDGIFLAASCERYIGLDSCGNAINSFKSRFAQGVQSNIEVMQSDFTDVDFNSFIDNSKRIFIYSRFSFHSIRYMEADRLLTNLVNIKDSSWFMAMEVRTIHDELYGIGESVGLHEFQTDHYRRFVDPDVFLEQLTSMFCVPHFELGRGFAPYKTENPLVLRIGLQPKLALQSNTQ